MITKTGFSGFLCFYSILLRKWVYKIPINIIGDIIWKIGLN